MHRLTSCDGVASLMICLAFFCILLMSPSTAIAKPAGQASTFEPNRPDPADQCAEGVDLYQKGDHTAAQPLVTKGFAAYKQKPFADLDTAGECGLVLGILLYNDHQYAEAIATITVVRTIFHNSRNKIMEGVTLKYLGASYERLGDSEQALAMYDAGAAIYAGVRLEEAKMHAAIARVHLANASDTAETTEYEAARDALESSLHLLTSADDVLYIQVLDQLAKTHVALAEYDIALARYEELLPFIVRLQDRAAVLDDIGIVSLTLKDKERAATALQEAADLWQELNSPERQGRSEALLLVIAEQAGAEHEEKARALIEDEQYEAAIAAYETAAEAYRNAVARKAEGDVWMEVGRLHAAMGEDEEAIAAYDSARVAYQDINAQLRARRYCSPRVRSFFNQTAGCATPLINDLPSAYARAAFATAAIGTIQRRQGELGPALNSYLQVLERLKSVNQFDDDAILEELQIQGGMEMVVEVRPSQVDAHIAAGEILVEQGRENDAQSHFNEALELLDDLRTAPGIGEVALLGLTATYTETHGLREAAVRNDLAYTYSLIGRPDAARDEYERGLALAREHTKGRANEATILYNLALLEMEEQNSDLATDYLVQANRLAAEIGAHDIQARALTNLAQQQDRAGNYTAARRLYSEALAHLGQVPDPAFEGEILFRLGSLERKEGDVAAAVDYIERSVNILELLRPASGSDVVRAEFAARFTERYAALIAIYHATGHDEQAFYASERSRARAFLDILATGQIQLQDSVSSTLLEEARIVYDELRAVQLRISYAGISQAQQVPFTELLARQEELQQEYNHLVAEIETEDSRISTLLPNVDAVATMTDTQALLDTNTTLVSYHTFDDGVIAFIIAPNWFRTVVLPINHTDLVQQINTLTLFANRTQGHPPAARKLYTMLIAPIKEYLRTSHLIVVPHGMLHYIPFAALTDGQKYLVDDYALSVAPSASTLQHMAARRATNNQKQRAPALIMAAPELQPATAMNLPLLRFAAAGALTLGAPNLLNATPLIGEQATETALRQAAPTAGIIHLAAHGLFEVGDPLASAILLAGDEKNDGRLSVEEVFELDLHRAELVVLSACQSQLNVSAVGNAINGGDEVFSLTRAFLFAGAPSVMATLWNVDDRAPELLVQDFYRRVLAGEDHATALQQAQIALRRSNPRYVSPYYWAGFVVTGN